MIAALVAIGFLALLLALVALFVCDRELQRLDQALAQLAKQAERAEAVAAYALCSIFPKLAEDERKRIPDRFYLAAVQAAALAQDAAKGGDPDGPRNPRRMAGQGTKEPPALARRSHTGSQDSLPLAAEAKELHAVPGGLPDTASGGVIVDLTKEAVQLPPSLPG